jgi:hypothetical protein
LKRAGPGTGSAAAYASRLSAGHPEGYLEGFAQIYRDTAELIAARLENREPAPEALQLPTIGDGVRGVRFIHAVVESSRRDAAWVDLASA